MEFLIEYYAPVIMGICVCVGYIIKHLIPSDKINRFIPLIAGVLGVGLNVWLQMSVTPLVVLTGLVSGLSSTGMYEAFEQLLRKNKR